MNKVAVVFDCNIYLSCAYLTGVPFTFLRLMKTTSHNRNENDRRLALLRGYSGQTARSRYQVFWNEHIAKTVKYKLMREFDWSENESNEFLHCMFVELIGATGGRTLTDSAEGWDRLTDHEDELVYAAAVQLVREDPSRPVLLVSDDYDFIQEAKRIQMHGSGPHRMIFPMEPGQFTRLGC